MDYHSTRELEKKGDRAELLLLALSSLSLRGGEYVGLYGRDVDATGGRATLMRLGTPVSYTHLTLPTICSV